MLANYTPKYNATVVSKLLKSGAVLVGKTNLDEFAMGSGTAESYYGPSINPWKSGLPFGVKDTEMKVASQRVEHKLVNDWHLSGGSSGGSAIAVATGSAFAALGSDTGGSTRHPAAHVGVCGFKPTYGLLSRNGLIPLTHSMDTPGVMAKYVADVRLVFDHLRGQCNYDSTSIDAKQVTSVEKLEMNSLRIGVPAEYNLIGMSDEIKKLWSNACDQFQSAGAKVVKVSLPHTKFSLSAYAVLKACDIASNFSCYDGIEYGYRAADVTHSSDLLYSKSRTEAFNETVKGFIMAGNYFLLKDNIDHYYKYATKIRRLICNDFSNVFKQVDVLLTPVTISDAPKLSQWSCKENKEHLAREDFCTQPANMAGLPSISVPCKLSDNGLPLGLQIIGPQLNDRFVLSVAEELENIMKFPTIEYYG